jgi:hypothetical protein
LLSLLLIAVGATLFGGFARLLTSGRDAMLAAAIVFGLILLAITELLSAANQFAFAPLLSAWVTALLGSVGFFLVARRSRLSRVAISKFNIEIAAISLGIGLIIVTVGITALICPPNNWDAMTYHMARVGNWIQHRSVSHYPTPNLRQLYLGPWSEFAVAHLQILSGSDRLANCVQWFAMIGCVVGVSRIAARLGVGSVAQAVTALFAASIPIVILESSNPQTDCVAGFWAVCAVNFGLGIQQTPARARTLESLFAAAVGLAFLTKATTAVFLAPFVVWIVIDNSGVFHSPGRQAGDRSTDDAIRLSIPGRSTPRLSAWAIRFLPAARLLLLLAVVPLLINAAHFYRNFTAFGRLSVPDAEAHWYHNAIHTPGAIVSNLARNILVNTTFHGMRSYPAIATKAVRHISGLDPSDPRITYPATQFKLKYTRDEHDAGNPVHLLLGSIALISALYRWRKNRPAAVYAACIVVGFSLFCFELKWQPWITRLQLPLFVLIAPLFGLLIDRLKYKFLVPAVCAILFAQSLIYLLYGEPRTLVGKHNIFNTSRADQYFSKRPDLAEPYEQAVRIIKQSHPLVVALASKGDSWEYPLRALLPAGTSIVYVGVTNQSRNCPALVPHGEPAFLVQLENAPIPAGFSAFHPVYHSQDIAVFAR